MDRYSRSSLKRQVDSRHSIKDEIYGVLIFIGVIWAVFLVDLIIVDRFLQIEQWLALVPRTAWGLTGILAMPFLHGGVGHIVSNTLPLLILLTLLAGSRARSWEIVAMIVVLNGSLVWIFGRPSFHIGASGLVFGLIGFLIASGFFERRVVSIVVALGVGFLYGGTLVASIVPQKGVSWEGHWLGVVAGIVVAYVLTRRRVDGESAR